MRWQSEDLNGGGELFLKKHKSLKVRMVDGSTLAAAVVLNSIPLETREVFMCVDTSKIGSAIVSMLSQRGVTIQLLTESREQLDQMKSNVPSKFQHNITPVSSCQEGKNCKVETSIHSVSIFPYSFCCLTGLENNKSEKRLVFDLDNDVMQIWIVGRMVSGEDQMKAPKGAVFIPILPFPIHRTRKDCIYQSTPAMRVPANLENVHACEVTSLNLNLPCDRMTLIVGDLISKRSLGYRFLSL